MKWIVSAGAPLCLLLGEALAPARAESPRTGAEGPKVSASARLGRWSATGPHWDREKRQHYFSFSHNCSEAIYCFVNVTYGGGRKVKYGQTIERSGRVYVGALARDDVAEPGAE